MAEVIRQCVDTALAAQETDPAALYARAIDLVGRFSDKQDATDLAVEHDRYLDESFR